MTSFPGHHVIVNSVNCKTDQTTETEAQTQTSPSAQPYNQVFYSFQQS